MATISLTVLLSTDMHGCILPDQGHGPRPSLAAMARQFDFVRSTCPNVILLDNGDASQGTPMANWANAHAQKNPMITTMNLAGYDAATLGNHEFDYGLEALQRTLEQSNFPYVCANLELIPPAVLPVLPYLILEKPCVDIGGGTRPIKIGITGCLPPRTNDWAADMMGGQLRVGDPQVAVSRAISDMRAEGADLTICLAHTGFGQVGIEDGENFGWTLSELDGLDVLVLGHVHSKLLENPSKGPAIIMPAAMARSFGQLTLFIEPDGDIIRNVALTACKITPVHKGIEAANIEQIKHYKDWEARTVGHCASAISTDFALIFPSTGLKLIADAKQAFGKEMLPDADLPILTTSSALAFGLERDLSAYLHLPAGKISNADLGLLYPFNNALDIVTVTASEVRTILLKGARCFDQINLNDRSPHWVIAGDIAPYEAAVIDGLDYQIDLTKAKDDPARIKDLRFDGQPLELDQQFHLVCNTYRLGNLFGGQDVRTRSCLRPEQRGTLVGDVLARYVKNAGTLNTAPCHSGLPWAPDGQVMAFYAPERAPPAINGLSAHGAHPNYDGIREFQFRFGG